MLEYTISFSLLYLKHATLRNVKYLKTKCPNSPITVEFIEPWRRISRRNLSLFHRVVVASLHIFLFFSFFSSLVRALGNSSIEGCVLFVPLPIRRDSSELVPTSQTATSHRLDAPSGSQRLYARVRFIDTTPEIRRRARVRNACTMARIEIRWA